MTNQEKITEFMVAAKQNIPNNVTALSPSVRQLRAHLMLEECLETIVKGLGITNLFYNGEFLHLDILLNRLNETAFNVTQPQNLVELADGIADMEYVNTGTAVAAGIDMQPVFDEVHRSNMTKFIDGTFREDGKYIKGPSYSKARIDNILYQMIEDKQQQKDKITSDLYINKDDPQIWWCTRCLANIIPNTTHSC